jgi:molybdopterin-guanine dinucleotide biosynthesis protein A
MPTPPIARTDVTGLVLAGGRASRMGGIDKGLRDHLGMPLALHALRRLAPQVGAVMMNANRNHAAYEAMGVPVWPDDVAGFAGPLAGMLAGLRHCATRYLVSVPCDTPNFPTDLVARLAEGLGDAEMAMALTREEGRLQPQPVFCLMHTSLTDRLAAFVAGGEARIGRWAEQQRCAQVVFDDARDFFNANTLEDLARLQAGLR